MIKVVGRNNCINCEMVKKTLNKKGIGFEYMLLEDLSKDYQDELISLSTEKGMLSLPLIINENNELLELQEVLVSVR